VGITGHRRERRGVAPLDRMAHRNRLSVMNRYFQHVLSMPLSFHGDTQSGRLMKVMLVGADHLFAIWLNFFREHLTTFIGLIVLLPLTLLMNWRLGLVLVALVIIFAPSRPWVISKTWRRRSGSRAFQTDLAGTAQDALTNVVVVQSFTRLNSESRRFGDIMRHVLDHQFPVLNWWAVVSVLTRAASTLAVITIFLLGTYLHMQGTATVGEIVAFMGFANLLIGRLEGRSRSSPPSSCGCLRCRTSSPCLTRAPPCRNGRMRSRSSARPGRCGSRTSPSATRGVG
jgi:ATP-binding cassette subfamily B protein